MQSHGESQLVAELPQWLKKQQAHRDVGAATSPRGRRGPIPEIDSPKFVGYEPPSRQKGGDTIAAEEP